MVPVNFSPVPKVLVVGIIVPVSLNFVKRTVNVLARYRWFRLFGCITVFFERKKLS